MKIRSVRAHPFGPIADAELSFGPGFTVVHGPNESGKSSWHVATTTALTGQRKGRARKAEKLFADRHRPWQHDGWAVSCVLDLDDGRSVRLLHNLARGTAQAINEITGADITDEFDNAGSVDAAKLIGLDRDTLPLVASVRQAEILQLAAAAASDDNVSALRGFLQQSVSSRASTDSTAEVALDRLSRFAAEAIGTEKRGSAKPLRQAREAAERAEIAVTECTGAWNTHQALQADLEEVEVAGRKIDEQIIQVRLAVAEQTLADAEAEHTTARSLADASTTDDSLAPESADLDALHEALVIHDQQQSQRGTGPGVRTPRHVAPSRAEDPIAGDVPVDANVIRALRTELAALPVSPEGDIEPRSEIVELHSTVRASLAGLDAHNEARPSSDDHDVVVAADADRLRSYALELEAPLPPDPEALAERPAPTESSAPSMLLRGAWLAVGAGLLLCLLALALIALNGSLSALIFGLFGLGAVAAIAGGLALSQAQRPTAEALAHEVHERATRQQATTAWQAAHARRVDLVADLTRQQLPAEADELRALAARADRAAVAADDYVAWKLRHAELQAAVDRHVDLLAHELALTSPADAAFEAGAGADADGGPIDAAGAIAAADRYFATCRRSAAQARAAVRRPVLEARLDSLVEAEQRQDAARRQRQAAEAGLRSAASAVGLDTDGDMAEVAEVARSWLAKQRADLTAAQQARQSAAQLDGLLAGRSMTDLEAAVTIATAQVVECRRVLEAQGVVATAVANNDRSSAPARLKRLESRAAAQAAQASELRGRLVEAESSLESLAQVLEHRDRAVAEYDRLLRLDALVRQTSTFLVDAREHLHRDIAPGIAEATKHRLATVSAGRYKEIRVDPEDLSVQVQLPNGDWRLAERLSHGTAEQVYLLVRAAIAEIVAPDVESCPLILDDVTVHADRERTIAMLETLEELSHDRQIILFSQELDVVDWAEQAGVGVVHLASV